MHVLAWLETLSPLLAASAVVGAGLGPKPGPAREPEIAPSTPDAPHGPTSVGILLFDGVELLDFTGPAEVFVVAREARLFRVHTVAEAKRPVKTMGDLEVTPTYDFDDAPAFDVVVVPGGAMRNVSARGIEWIRAASAKARVTMSVCMGALLLAKAGLLEGIEATTHHWGLDQLQRLAPTCRVVTGRRFVDAGRIVTTAGVTAGIDGALHVVERLHGAEAAAWTAKEWMEHPTPATGP